MAALKQGQRSFSSPMNPLTLLKRAFSGNPGGLAVSEEEQERMAMGGVTEPAIQRYLVWRRALIAMVLVATVLSAGLTTYRNLTEEEDGPELLDAMMEKIMGKAQAFLPGADKLEEVKAKMEKVKENLPELPIPGKAGADDEEKVKDAADKVKAVADKLKGGKKAAGAAEEDEAPEKPKTGFEKFTDAMESAPLYVLALMALAALIAGDRLKISFRLLSAGFLFGFLVPMLVAVCPWSWFGVEEQHYSLAKEPVLYFKDMAEGLKEGLGYLVMLLPTVLSLVPGVLKGCLRVKRLLPPSLLPGWFIVMAAPLYGLFLLVIFIAVDQVTAEPLILGGMALLVLAHFVYAFRAEAFTAPLLEEKDFKRLGNALLMVLVITLAAGGLLLTFLLTREVMGVHVFGTDPKKSLMQPLDLVEYGLEFVARSMFVTALSVDLFMRMNLTLWSHIRTLAATPDALEYQKAMNALESAVG